MLQDYLVYLILLLTAASLVYKFIKKPQAAKNSACGGCAGCSGCSVGQYQSNGERIKLHCAIKAGEKRT